MSLINQMLKDLEARRSRDLETSESLSDNISWETKPKRKSFNWLVFFVAFVLFFLLVIFGYLLWERTTSVAADKNFINQQVVEIERIKNATAIKLAEIKAKEKIREEERARAAKKLKLLEEENARARKKEAIERKARLQEKRRAEEKAEKLAKIKLLEENKLNAVIDSKPPVEIDDSPVVNLKKKHRPLNNKQLAEIAYNKGYKLLQRGSMHKGKEYLREALSLYIPHIKAREMLAGIYIKSGNLISAAELLREGVQVVPEYPLFAQLYARVLLEQNNPRLAIRVLERGASVMVVEPDYHALLAATYQRVNQHQKSIDLYLKLVKVRPNEGVWWLGLAISLEKTGKNKQALEAYQRAQKTGSLKSGLIKFTNNRVSALKEIGFPESE